MKPYVGRRTWVKLWVHDWLEGTTRYQMSDGQRAFWIDLLAMAGRSRYGGVVCSGKDGDRWIGYPLAKFQGLLSESFDVLSTFELFHRTGKITFEIDGESQKLYTLFITNWTRYQCEYERQKQSRSKRVTPGNTEELHPELHSETRKGYTTDVETEAEVESETDTGRQQQPPPRQGSSDISTSSEPKGETSQTLRVKTSPEVIEAFEIMEQEPFGSPRFQETWTKTVQKRKQTAQWSDVMEECIANCNADDIKIPRKFFAIKHNVEDGEVNKLFGK